VVLYRNLGRDVFYRTSGVITCAVYLAERKPFLCVYGRSESYRRAFLVIRHLPGWGLEDMIVNFYTHTGEKRSYTWGQGGDIKTRSLLVLPQNKTSILKDWASSGRGEMQ